MRFNVNGNQTFELIEAYTRKSDGRQIAVNQTDIVNQDGAVGPMLSYVDLKIRQIPFKSVAVGDTVVVTVRYTQSRHYLGDGFSMFYGIAASGADVTTETTIRRPRQCRSPIPSSSSITEERRPTTPSYIAGAVTSRYLSRRGKNVADLTARLPRFSFSTFRNYEEIGAAFYAGAAACFLEVTPAIAGSGRKITRGKTDRRAQAEAIFGFG